MIKNVRCGECGSKNVLSQNVKGRLFPFMAYTKVKILKDLSLSVCQECDNIILQKGDAISLDKALSDSIMLQARGYIENILGKVGWKQNEMADCVGFTPVYLSELKNGKRIPEYRTFNYFKILSECPGALELVLEYDPKYIKAPSYRSTLDAHRSALENFLQLPDAPAAGNDYAMAA